MINLVFDLGGVRLNWQPRALVAQSFPALATTPAQAAALADALFGHPDWLDFDRGILAIQTLIDRTAARLNQDPDAVADLIQHYITEQLVPIPSTVALLDRMRQNRQNSPDLGRSLRLYYLSNMSQEYARAVERFDMMAWFDGGIFSGDVQWVKPDPAIYLLLQNRFALVPSQTVFIDDMPHNVQAATALGWRGIHFQSAAQLADVLADVIGW